MAAMARAAMARAHVAQLCAARNPLRLAEFRTSAQAVLDRSPSTPASAPNSTVAPVWEDFGVPHSPASCRDAVSSGFSGSSRGFATKDGATPKPSSSPSDLAEERRVNSKVRDELKEPEGGLKDKATHAVRKVGEKVQDAGQAIKGSTDSKTVDEVGDTVKGAGDSIKAKGSRKQHLGKEDVVTT